ncbi:MAG: methyltransferase domain-containing protein [Candidatus Thalassarchaeaceae archaeon]|nr:methyltransferase domain-containing protein [Candidatus Thalassarchaeaceae archaeon]
MEVNDIAGNPVIRSALGDSFPASPTVTLRLAEEAGIDQNSRVLHIGAGVGTVCQLLTETFGCHSTGIVEMEELLEYADFDDERVTYLHAPLTQPPFEPESFSHILIEARCFVIPNLQSVLISAKSVLQSNGILIVNDAVVSEGGQLPSMVTRMMGETRLQEVMTLRTSDQITSEIQEAGFTIKSVREEPEVTERILGKLQRVSLMMKMALRLAGFDPKAYGIPFTTKEVLQAYEEVRTSVADDTIQWFSWSATPF